MATMRKPVKLMDPSEWPLMLVTVDDWFKGPDGLNYKALYGPIQVVETKALVGFNAHGNANYVVLVGKPGRQVALAGCRVHYMAMAPERPTVMHDVLDLSR